MSKKITITIEDDDAAEQQLPKVNVWPIEYPSQTVDDYPNYTNKTITFPGSQLYSYNPCKNCPNNPQNGGSGVCGCTLPSYYGPFRVTC